MMIERFQECRVAVLREIDQRCALLVHKIGCSKNFNLGTVPTIKYAPRDYPAQDAIAYYGLPLLAGQLIAT